MNHKTTIVADDALAQQHSDQLKRLIAAEIEKQGGFISFADFMQYCLYQPGLGYYSAGSHKLGEGGDFTTAPEISSLFGYAFANHIQDALSQCQSKNILEFGAGSGQLAVAILSQLQLNHALPERYFILEISADLRSRQQQLIAEKLPELFECVAWIDCLPENFTGVMLANEVCDAMPVHLLRFINNDVFERCVTTDNGSFTWQETPLSNAELLVRAEHIKRYAGESEYFTEVGLAVVDWLKTLASVLQQGAIFLIDYGYSFSELYSPHRTQGTLRSYYQHQAVDDPLQLVGLQDISAHVDFSTLADTALAAGLHVAGFHEQGDFLLAGSITEIAAQIEAESDSLSWLKHSAGLKQLLLPDVMGHQFKVLSLARELELLPRLQSHDRRYQL
ncbi:class I SAM-dependent methyltransferase [Methylophaga sp.]|uniref:class I SAM-dependent methyltransferase n=1 Tax=Methylophaga sp. TaxID=2024840 RepID=UPI003F698009